MDAQGQNRDSKSKRPRSEDVDLLDSIASLLKVDINLEESRDFAAEVIKEGSHAVQTKVKPSYPLSWRDVQDSYFDGPRLKPHAAAMPPALLPIQTFFLHGRSW